jgi:hypothetical protein
MLPIDRGPFWMFTGKFLRNMWSRAKRKKILFSALDRVERGILYLTSKLVDRVKSLELGIEIVKILAKLQEAMKSGFQRYIESYGVEKAKEMIEIAESFGIIVNWLDMNYVKYLALIAYNNPIGW